MSGSLVRLDNGELAMRVVGYEAPSAEQSADSPASGAGAPMSGKSASAAFTPAAAEHVAGDVHGGAGTFALGAPAGCVFEIQSVSMMIAGGTVETTVWTLHLFTVTPPSAIADDGAFALPSGDRASYVGFITIPQVVDYGDTLWIEAHNLGKRVKLASAGTGLFGYLVNVTTLTPAAVAHTVTITGKPVG